MPITAEEPAAAVASPPTLKKNSDARMVHWALLAVSFCFATFPVAGKWAMESFAPRTVATWRVVVGAAVLLLLAWRSAPKSFILPRKDLFTCFWLSLIGVSINQILYIEGLKRSSATSAGLFMTIIPVLTYGIAVLIGRERMIPRKVLGIFAAAAGVSVLFFARGSRLAGDRLAGDICVILNATSYSVYLVLAKPLLTKRPAIVVIAWIFFFGALVVPLTNLGEPWIPTDPTPRAFWALVWTLLFPTIAAYGLNTWALERTEASIVGIYVCLQPLLNMLLAAVLLGERVTWPAGVAGVLVLFGVWCVTRAASSNVPRKV
jgi:drug/metabolite transporter (DMT)-like permease